MVYLLASHFRIHGTNWQQSLLNDLFARLRASAVSESSLTCKANLMFLMSYIVETFVCSVETNETNQAARSARRKMLFLVKTQFW